ncbi:MAG: hypothetical protein KJO04_10330 [Bacteroidia bacterium]|nr:hypothetical protein [Bacteroidia bacterium]
MKREILTGILGLATTALAFGMQTGNSPIHTPHIEGDSIAYIEEEIPVDLGFDTATYLPEGFDAYDLPENIMDISYIEEEARVELDFDLNKYLPKAFNPYKEYFDLNSIQYIEDEEVIEFDFDIQDYLPADFTPVSTF